MQGSSLAGVWARQNHAPLPDPEIETHLIKQCQATAKQQRATKNIQKPHSKDARTKDCENVRPAAKASPKSNGSLKMTLSSVGKIQHFQSKKVPEVLNYPGGAGGDKPATTYGS